MTAQPPDQSARRRTGVPRPQLIQLEIAIGRLRFVVIAVLVGMIAGFAVLGAQIRRLNTRIDQLAAKMDGTDVAFGVKFDETNATLEAISERLAVQLKTMEAEIAAIAKGSAAVSSLAPPAPVPAQPESTPVQPVPAPIPKPTPPSKARP
jgi:hypothetical protein